MGKTEVHLRPRHQTIVTLHQRLSRLFLIGIMALAACFTGLTAARGEESRMVIFMETAGGTADEVRLELDAVRLVGETGEQYLPLKHTEFNSLSDAGKNLILAEASIPPGRYSSLRIFVREMTIGRGDSPLSIPPIPEGITIPIEVDVAADDAEPVFLLWTPDTDLKTTGIYRPRFQIVHPPIPPIGSLAFVSLEGAGGVAVIDRYAFRVVDIIKTGAGPGGMVYARLSRELYVANAESHTISIIDANTLQVIRTIDMNFGDSPCRLDLSPDEQTLYVVNRGSNSLVSIDTRSYQETDRATLGLTPNAITIDRFAGTVYVGNKSSDNISVYEPIDRTIRTAFSTDGSPGELWANADSKSLYLSYSDQRLLTVLDSRTGARTATMNLCAPVTGLAYNRSARLLLVSQGRCSEIAVLRPELNLDLGGIRVPGEPGLLVIDPENRLLVVVLSNIDSLAFINLNSRKVTVVIEVGRRPYMAVVPG